MGFLSAITSVVSTVLPHVIDFVRGGTQEVIRNLDGDLAGVDATFNPTDSTRYGLAKSLSSPSFSKLVENNPILKREIERALKFTNDSPLTHVVGGMLDDNDRKGEEVLVVTQGEIERRQVVQAMLEQARIEHLVLEMPLEGLKRCKVVVNASYKCIFCPRVPEVEEKGVNYITPGNHVEIQLIPRKYNNFTQLMNHELVKLETVRLTSQSISGYSSSTFVGYIPYAKNTLKINNQVLRTITKLNESYPIDYTVRYFSPALVEYNGSTGEYNPQSVYFEPNKPIRADYVRNAYNNGEKKMLSFGTFVILKENVGEDVIADKYNIEMTFAVWDYINMGMSLEAAQKQWEDEHPNGDDDDGSGSGSGSGSSPSTGCGRRRRAVN